LSQSGKEVKRRPKTLPNFRRGVEQKKREGKEELKKGRVNKNLTQTG